MRLLLEPERLLLCGDTHGDCDGAIEHKRYLCEVALEHNCDALFQLGDWGYLPHFRAGQAFIDATHELLNEYNLFEYFLDGNHDSFDALWGQEWQITPEGFYWLGPRLFYAPRGLRWSWSGAVLMALGGAYSQDRAMRLASEERMGAQRVWYWPEETITSGDIYRATLEKAPIDVLLTHDAPWGVRVPGFSPFSRSGPAYLNRVAIRSVVELLKPSRLYHGHLHHRYDAVLRIPRDDVDCAVHGLAQYGQGEKSWMVLDLKEFGFHGVRLRQGGQSPPVGA